MTTKASIRERQSYGVFVMGRWARTNNRKEAIRFARKVGGVVKAMPYYLAKGAWDAPTFWALSDTIYIAEEVAEAKA